MLRSYSALRRCCPLSPRSCRSQLEAASVAPFSHPLGDGSSCCPSLMVLLFPGPRRAWSPKDLLQAVIGHPTSGPACRILALLWQSLGACHSGPDYACYLPLHRAVLPPPRGGSLPSTMPISQSLWVTQQPQAPLIPPTRTSGSSQAASLDRMGDLGMGPPAPSTGPANARK